MSRQRFVVAISLWFLVALGVIVPLVWLINNRDWGVALMLLSPFYRLRPDAPGPSAGGLGQYSASVFGGFGL